MRGLAIRVGVIAAILGGAFLFRNFLPSNAGNLAVGDCFDPPSGSGTVEDVQHHPCTDAHGAEVIFVGSYEPATDAYPSDDEFLAFFDARCFPAFIDYTGLDVEAAQAASLDFHAYTPTTDGWTGGDRKVICYIIKTDGSQMTSSVKKAS